jgi:alkylhydroperoxidase family enzyme
MGDEDLAALSAAGFEDAQIIEIVLHIGLNTLISYVNKVGDTDLDFSLVRTRKAY